MAHQTDADFELLTPRQREYAALAIKGLRNKQIARQLGVSEGTVKAQLTTIYRKLGIHNRTALTMLAYRHKFEAERAAHAGVKPSSP